MAVSFIVNLLKMERKGERYREWVGVEGESKGESNVLMFFGLDQEGGREGREGECEREGKREKERVQRGWLINHM